MDTPTASAGTALAGTTTAGTTTAGTATASADTAQDTKGKTPKAIRTMPASRQRSLAGRYSVSVQAVALAAFAWAFFGWLNESYLYWFENPIWLNRYTEYVIILAFGVWRISAEENIYTKKRLAVLLAVVTVLWWLIPWLIPFYEPYVGYMTSQPVFPSLHTPGTLTFFLTLGAVFLFGRRVICGWGCPCVGIRETVGFPFRSKTLTGPTAWKWRHVKWIFFALYVAAAYAIFNWAPNSWTSTFLGLFTLLVVIPYFATFFLTPITGNRFYCRYMCPYGATFGLLNKVGFFRIDFNKETCTDCDLCEMVCDMGIPVVTIGRAEGKVDTTECMGCGRCVTECPSRSLAFHDIRNIAFPALRQDGRVLKESSGMASPVLRRHAALFTLMMVAVALLAGWFFTALGSAAELSSNLVGLVCGH